MGNLLNLGWIALKLQPAQLKIVENQKAMSKKCTSHAKWKEFLRCQRKKDVNNSLHFLDDFLKYSPSEGVGEETTRREDPE
ncbi:hypothetical protein Y1Q_0002048 [Alligator mississippiensis]|uniref:Uncharacterized protein n=1 Tax=Alligator mississippiensis TaxID=8496 RepID=A0A151MIQ7_ALLMI|nr:hypothetical protein Y1Q_0002048 [Alligator mississippiensis]